MALRARLLALRADPPRRAGDVANDFSCHTPAQARADALAMAGLLRTTCRPIRAMRAGTMRDVYSVHPVTGHGADRHNTRRAAFGPPVPPKADLVQQARAAAAHRAVLAAAVADPADPSTETGDAYADRQMAAYGVEPTRWTTDTLMDAHAHLIGAGTYPEHMAAIGAELVTRGAPDAKVHLRERGRIACGAAPHPALSAAAIGAFQSAPLGSVCPTCARLVAQRIAARHRAAGHHLLADAALLRVGQGVHPADPLPAPHIPHPEALPPVPRPLLLRLGSPAVARG